MTASVSLGLLAKGGRAQVLEGKAPASRVVIIEFDDLEQANRFRYSDEYAAIIPTRQRSASARAFIVEGV